MVSQPFPSKRFPGSFFVKGARKASKPISPLQLDTLENRTTPAAGLGSQLFPFPEPYAELSLIAAVNPHEPLDLVGEKVAEWSLESQGEEASFQDCEWDEDLSAIEESMEDSVEEVDELVVNESQRCVPSAAPESSAPSITVDMKRKPSVEPAEVAKVMIRSMEMELGKYGTATAGARSFGGSDPVFPSGVTPTSQFLIRPGLVKPIQSPSPEKAPRTSGQLAAWGAVMASGAAHLATTLPTKRRLAVESRPQY